ncbi:retrovirus-related Pol polyprotein from transposon 297 [Trichonephila clavipes]|nr:retrovirus-related Pol polyprotein from transposon 297 [Trichonephila clavipes]
MKFSTHQKQPEALWKDFTYELNNYLEGWLHSLEVKDFNSLKDWVLTDQLKKRVAKEVKEHFVDIWGDIKSSSELVQKLDDYEVARGHSQFESRNPLSCYGCGKPGYIKSKCTDCNSSKGDPAHFGILRINSLSPSNRNAVLRISINEVSGTALAKSGASHSIAGETLYTILLKQGAALEKTVISLSFADGIVTQKEVLRTFQTVILEVSPNRINPARKELDSLLQQGIIVECESPYASAVVLIPKPNGSMPLCIDYRKLNAQTVPDSYPLPRMNDLLNEAKPIPYMSTIDLRSGYHQVKVAAEHQDKTAFTCPFGIYKFTRMPFGLRNAPATFQRKHLSDLEQIFKRLSLSKLNANREKCNFCCKKVKYLGHYITKEGISVDPQKTAAIADMSSPTSVKQVQSFVQTCSWYRRYIPNFSQIAKPLTDLTKKNAMWKWGSEQEEAFRDLKLKLASPPVLKPADGTKPFVIRTDASSVALGVVLLQGDKDEEHPIEYTSRLLSSSERNYSTTERKALAVVWALEKFKVYVKGQTIRLSSDHQPLKWLLSLKSPTGRLSRWALQIQSYNLTIDYIPGRSNFIADLLSRPTSEQEKADCDILAVFVDFPTRSPKEVRQEQLKGDELKKIIECFENNEKSVNFDNWLERGYLMNQGILFRYSPTSVSEEAQLVVPIHERQDILKIHHDAPNAECNRYKPSNQKPSGLLRTPVYSQRFETISIDFFGPLPESPSGKKWIFIVEDCCTRWVELFALPQATARECATTLMEEVILRYGLPRRLISGHGSQFVGAVMQQLCFILNIDQNIIPVYHPQANPVERKNRDLKPRIAILVKNRHDEWEDKLPSIRFALNSAKCDTTGKTAFYLQFGREMRTIDDVTKISERPSMIKETVLVPCVIQVIKCG